MVVVGAFGLDHQIVIALRQSPEISPTTFGPETSELRCAAKLPLISRVLPRRFRSVKSTTVPTISTISPLAP
jgi:hypothetical protein